VTKLALTAHRSPALRLPRLLAGISYYDIASLRDHEERYGPLPLWGTSGRRRPGRLIDVVDASGLTGRGGGGFPTGRKMRSVAAGPGGAVVVANGAEGEPASCKDRLLLTRLPHTVLDGITLAAHAVRARSAYLCIHGQETELRDALEHALAERRAVGLDPVPIQLRGIPGRYVASEQSAIVQYLNDGPAKPTFSPPRPHQRGVGGRPTLVNNVETLAHLALIARYGDRWFRGAGLPAAPGSALVTVSGAVRRPGVYEIQPGSSCGLAETARVIRYLADENAGQCGPCMFGLPALADAMADLAYQGCTGRAAERVATLAGLVDGRGACRHPDGAVQLARSALRAFEADVRRHDQRGPCPAAARPPLLPVPGEADWDWA